MVSINFKDVEDFGLILINLSTFTLFGMLISQWNYDIPVLFDPNASPSHFDRFLQHYFSFNSISIYTVIFYGFIYGLGLLGAIVRVTKPHPDYQLFEYGTFVLIFLFLCVFLTNVKTGIEACSHRKWGDVTEKQGLQVLAASNLILLVILLGVIILQAGLWYTKWEYQKRLNEFYEEEKKNDGEKKEDQPKPKANVIPKEELESISEEQPKKKTSVKKRGSKK